jgi:anhydro-N-acetylmuramic acid kinase
VASRGLFVGLMSGTSIDGIDAALVRIDGAATELVATHSEPFSPDLATWCRRVAAGEDDDLDSIARLDRALGVRFADAVIALLASARTPTRDVVAIGSHGQTVRHRPGAAPAECYSIQLGDPSTIAENTGITTVADFRRRDIAAGGEGAPLVPAFHAARFGCGGSRRAIVNIGGIANATLLHGTTVLAGFDCGPGNTLLDAWTREHRGDDFDADGAWSAEHAVDPALLGALLDDPYLQRRGPRSTGPEHFNLAWLREHLEGEVPPGMVQATLCVFTASCIAASLRDASPELDAVFVCGGGARNTDLLRRLHRHLDAQRVRLGSTDELGLAPEWVEACAFAWLAQRTLAGLAGNAPAATGAAGPRVLGGIYPGRVASAD